MTNDTYTPEEIHQKLSNRQVTVDSNQAHIGGLYGWICPKCGSVVSPFVSFCPNCTKHNFEITCSSENSNIKSSFDVQQFIGGRKDKLGYE